MRDEIRYGTSPHKNEKEDPRCFSEVIEKAGEDKKVKVNALIKRGALHIQKCLGKSLRCQPQIDTTTFSKC
jgi:hypothetical protein